MTRRLTLGIHEGLTADWAHGFDLHPDEIGAHRISTVTTRVPMVQHWSPPRRAYRRRSCGPNDAHASNIRHALQLANQARRAHAGREHVAVTGPADA